MQESRICEKRDVIMDDRKPSLPSSALETHFTVDELCQLWKLSRRTIIRLITDQPGVLEFGPDDDAYHKPHKTRRVPESVVVRIHRQLCAGNAGLSKRVAYSSVRPTIESGRYPIGGGRVTNYAEVIALTMDGSPSVSRGQDCEMPSIQG
jgi:hypothetical protein